MKIDRRRQNGKEGLPFARSTPCKFNIALPEPKDRKSRSRALWTSSKEGEREASHVYFRAWCFTVQCINTEVYGHDLENMSGLGYAYEAKEFYFLFKGWKKLNRKTKKAKLIKLATLAISLRTPAMAAKMP